MQTFRKWFVLGLFALLILFGFVISIEPLINPRMTGKASQPPGSIDNASIQLTSIGR